MILPHGEDNRRPPLPLMLNVTMTHDRYGRTTQHATGLPDPVVFMTLIFLHAHREASVLT